MAHQLIQRASLVFHLIKTYIVLSRSRLLPIFTYEIFHFTEKEACPPLRYIRHSSNLISRLHIKTLPASF